MSHAKVGIPAYHYPIDSKKINKAIHFPAATVTGYPRKPTSSSILIATTSTPKELWRFEGVFATMDQQFSWVPLTIPIEKTSSPVFGGDELYART